MNPMEGIHPPLSFRMILERERARAERTGYKFSLILFSFDHEEGSDGELLEQLGKILVKKVRMSDDVGWYEEGKSMGALLPGTYTEGAWQFVDIIKEKLGDERSSLVSTVYTYPNSEDLYDRREEAADGKDPRSNKMSPRNVGAKSMEVLFARPIPIWKRVIDFLGALLFLILLSPVFLIVALFIKIVSPGPVFYRQERIGYLGRKFWLWKFRTMHVNSNTERHRQYLIHLIENEKPMTKLDGKKDDRIIPFAKFLRISCLDELPQLINVLKGDMSLVGPRPCLPYESEEFLQWHTRRLDIVPGMTGLWQVNGKNRTTFKDMIRLDIRYRRKMSPWLDAKIILLTGPAIVEMVAEAFAGKVKTRQEREGFTQSRREEFVRRLKP